MNDIKGIIEDCNKSDLVSDRIIKKVIEIIGQEEWQDLHDENSDICTTMGELIITLKGIPDLEKENAELKKQLEMSNKVYNDNLDYSHHIEEQLTKATDIMKRLVNLSNSSRSLLGGTWHETLREMEDFLKDSEVNK